MYVITESKNYYGNCYHLKTLSENNKISNEHIVQIKSFVTNINNEEITMLYNSEMQPIEHAIRFINFEMKNQSLNYILQAITAIKLLYCYLELFNISLEKMTKKQAKAFLEFIKGISRDGLIYKTEFITLRQNETILSYLKVIRKYVEYLEYENHVFLLKSSKLKTVVMPESNGATTINTYDINVKTKSNDDFVPVYISVQDYKNILSIIDKEYTKRDRILCRLMFEHGCRLGECLGLTLEDIRYKEKDNFEIEYYIELRNRLSDTNEQKCKTCMRVRTPLDYKEKDYRKKGVGYHKIVLSLNLAEELLEYINTNHNSSDKRYMDRYYKFSKADSVPGGNRDIQNNYYLFLNSLGRPLSENLWNKYLRVIFEKSGLIVDDEIRRNNLSHRFRHGYAMYLTKILKLDPFTVKTLMRHKQLSTTQRYHNPTPDDIDLMQNQIIEIWDHSLLKDKEVE